MNPSGITNLRGMKEFINGSSPDKDYSNAFKKLEAAKRNDDALLELDDLKSLRSHIDRMITKRETKITHA